MPNFYAGYLTEVYAGAYDWTEFFNKVDPTQEIDTVTVAQFRKKGKRKVGLQADGSMDFEGLWDYSHDAGVTDGPEEFFRRMFVNRQVVPVTVGLGGGTSVGDRCRCGQMRSAKFQTTVQTTDIHKFTLSLYPDTGAGLDSGVILLPMAAQTVTVTGAAVDLGAGSANGAAGYLHVFAKAGTTPTLNVVVESSSDNGVGDPWATALTFTQMTAPGSQVVEISGAVEQYVRAKATIAGATPSFTFAVAFCPR